MYESSFLGLERERVCPPQKETKAPPRPMVEEDLGIVPPNHDRLIGIRPVWKRRIDDSGYGFVSYEDWAVIRGPRLMTAEDLGVA